MSVQALLTGENAVSRLVDRYLAGDDESEPTMVERVAAKTRELVAADRPLAYFVGAVELHLETMRQAM